MRGLRTAIVLLISSLVVECFGMAMPTDLTVRSWKQIGANELEVKVIDSQSVQKTIHIRFNPNRITDLIHNKDRRTNAKRQYDEAFAVLKEQLEQSKTIHVWLYSDKGFIPISGQPGHYRTDWMYMPSWDKEGKRVCLVPSDLGSKSPD
jgi:hypothetical protein